MEQRIVEGTLVKACRVLLVGSISTNLGVYYCCVFPWKRQGQGRHLIQK